MKTTLREMLKIIKVYADLNPELLDRPVVFYDQRDLVTYEVFAIGADNYNPDLFGGVIMDDHEVEETLLELPDTEFQYVTVLYGRE